jgi:FtsP/CotA-like multicopper oxidase with cupredoxin domain
MYSTNRRGLARALLSGTMQASTRARCTANSFELTRVAGQATSGVIKDFVMVGGFQEVEIDFVADNPGLTLCHCHRQLHMDFGFMSLFEYA